MTREELDGLFEKYNKDEYLKFERIQNKVSNRPDLHAFILLDKLQPGESDIISAAEHDEFFLDIDLDKLAEVITEEQVLELVRCGVFISGEYGDLQMFA